MPMSEYDYAWKKNIGFLTNCSFAPDGAPEALDPASFSLTSQESQQMDWNLNIPSGWSRHVPLNTTTGWYGVMENSRKNHVNLTYGGMPFSFTGVSTGWGSSEQAPSHITEFNWRGKCLSQLLFVENITMASVRNRMASEVAAEILNAARVQHDLTQLRADDYQIPVFHRQDGSYMDWLGQILEVPMLQWKMRNGTIFTPYLTAPDSSAHWVYDADTVIESRSEESSLQSIVNRVYVIRAAENAEVVPADTLLQDEEPVEQEPDAPGTECEAFGEYTVEFDQPLWGVTWRVAAAEGGIFSDFRCYNAQGVLMAVRDPRSSSTIPQNNFGFGYPTGNPYGGSSGMYDPALLSNGSISNVSKIVFTWGEAPGNVIMTTDVTGTISVSQDLEILGGYGRIEFIGTKGQPNFVPVSIEDPPENDGTVFDPGFRVQANNTLSQARLAAQGFPNGGVRSVELTANPLIPNSTDAQRFADRYIWRVSRQSLESTFSVPLHPLLEVGHRVRIVDYKTSTSRVLLVIQVTHLFSTSPAERGTSFRAVEYVN